MEMTELFSQEANTNLTSLRSGVGRKWRYSILEGSKASWIFVPICPMEVTCNSF